MKRILFLLLIFFTLIAGGTLWWSSVVKPPSAETALRDFLIVKGSSASQIGNKLEKEGFVRSALAFKIYVQVSDQARSIQAGEYRLSQSYSFFKLIDELIRGPAEIWVTIPEGLRREEIAERFASAFGQEESFSQEFLSATRDIEGFLFPDTYLFPKDASASSVVNKMRSTFDVKTAELKEGIDASNLTLREIVILASIIERETKTDEERPMVAGVLINRLDIGMGLQADATVQYAVGSSGKWWPILTRENLQVNSPYNTYLFRGLPPAPIANPGLSSIEAAVFPEESDYLYYLHDASGQVYFARTLAEHNENVRKYLGK
ncbi:MAG: hypothetical protein UX88_C0004G0010 [Candidatus Woesebacteria bacterium GW2011_GWC2_47_16]|uniref:Endolytic murein transglycosylase n=2 Tax=Candidatus Woeseibacteriota TaxID=1752722 RepID=A0A0G1S799_9BACT|nr:MAG: hypothetical protein UX88_C0004G0010 [Candidatus Woesebacteria bacterium GW2011_GWC2_47_16]OGM86684.1 MAG: hypothetical protein A2435_02600 [Candidatus Woesebacteria bacterium RIFOXYC1_FULL_46_16]